MTTDMTRSSRRGSRATAPPAGLAVLALASAAHAETASALLREGDDLLPGHPITALNNTAVNHVGGYACSLNTTAGSTLSRIWGNAAGGPGALLRTEGTFEELVQTSFESFWGMGDGGELAYSPLVNDLNSGETSLDAVWLDDAVVLMELMPVPSLAGQFSTFNSRPTAAGDGVPVWIGGFADTPGAATQNRALFSGFGADVLLMGGDFLPGIAEAVDGVTGLSFDFRVSRFRSHWINVTEVLSAAANDVLMVIDAAPITAGGSFIREGTLVPVVLGGNGVELWTAFDFFGINEAGDYLITGNTNAAAAANEFVAINGELVLREGDVLNLALAPVTLEGDIEGAYMNEQGDWAAAWDIDDGVVNREALIVNGGIVLVEGDLVDWNGDGVIDAGDNNGELADFTGISALTIGARIGGAVDVYFTADIDFLGTPGTADDLEGFMRVRVQVVPCPWDCAGNDGVIDVVDFLALLSEWAQVGTPCDFNGDGVDVVDFLKLLGAWGPCP
jgi:hypothetical protein